MSGALFHDVPMQGQGVESGRLGGADRQQSDAVLAGDLRPGGRGHRGHGHVEQRDLSRAEVEPGVAQVPAVVAEGQRLVARQQVHDDVDALGQQVPGLVLVETDHGGVGRERPRPQAEHEATAGQVVEQHGAFGHPERIVIADADHAGTELDVHGSAARRWR